MTVPCDEPRIHGCISIHNNTYTECISECTLYENVSEYENVYVYVFGESLLMPHPPTTAESRAPTKEPDPKERYKLLE